MKIAVLIGGARFDSQRKIINGILEEAIEDDVNIFIFTCDVWTYSASHYHHGEAAIFDLPDFRFFDGVILHGDTIYNQDIMKSVVKRIKEARVPCISLNVNYSGMLYMGMENEGGIYEIVTHLIEVHKALRLGFISGPIGNSDSIGRLNGYKKALREHGIKLNEAYIFYGDYHPESGKEAVDYFYKMEDAFPDAIVAANDEMALGAFYELQTKGYEVPGQVLLTGYDYAFAGRNHYPKITSVKRPETELGKCAFRKLKDYIDGKPVKKAEELMCAPVFTESCGCEDQVREDEKSFRRRFAKTKLHITTYSEIIKSSSADFTGAVTFEQLLDKIRKYMILIDPEEFYLCMCITAESFEEEVLAQMNQSTVKQEAASYSAEICIPVIYRNRKFEQYGRFRSEELLPAEFLEGKKGAAYTVVPLHYQRRCYGYCVLGNSRLMIDSELFHLFIMNINNALENIRKQNMMNAMVERLNKMWVYDTLTGAFNRGGFFRFSNQLIEEARSRKNDLFVLFLDLDGLKGVNDRYGHEEGDELIKAMANILSQVHRDGELLMRYGGDEFVVLAQGYTHEQALHYMERIQLGMKQYNETFRHSYTLDASMGYAIVAPAEDLDLKKVIESADREMYKVKNEKKKKKGEKGGK